MGCRNRLSIVIANSVATSSARSEDLLGVLQRDTAGSARLESPPGAVEQGLVERVSSRRICVDTADCDTRSRAAVRVRLPSSATAQKSWRW